MDLKGRNFLTLKDYTPEEITYLLELSAKYKAEEKGRRAGIGVQREKYRARFLKRRVREHAAPLRWQHMIWVCSAHIWTRAVLRSVKKRVYAIPRACLAECMMVSSTAALVRRSWKSLRKYAGVPVWNGLTNEYHPTQMLADMLTIQEHLGELKARS